MPRINLNDQDPSSSSESSGEAGGGVPPIPEEYGNEPNKKTPWLIFIALILVAGLAIVFLNQKNIIHLWGRKAPHVVEALPEPAPTTPNDSAAMAVSSSGGSGAPAGSTTSPEVGQPSSEHSTTATREQVTASPSGASDGGFAIQISSWPGKKRADAIVNDLNGKGFRAYVVDGVVNGATWYRVRVGNYASSKEATGAVASLGEKGFAGGIVVQVGK